MNNQEIIGAVLIGTFFIVFSFLSGYYKGYYDYWFINIFRYNKRHNKYRKL